MSFDMKKMLNQRENVGTRRNVLKLANSLFDPLGLLSPFIIVIKMIFKKVCADERKFSWDAVLPAEYEKEIANWASQLPEVEKIKIPRVLPSSADRSKWSLYVFSDASKDAYACGVYLRVEEGSASVQLIQARARVTPMKNLTIPRAELLGCFIAARLYAQVKEDLDLEGVPVTFWTDATLALTWITRLDAVCNVFTNYRVNEIRQLSDVKCWRHVPGEANPADLPSRGSSVAKYLHLKWWEGPVWLRGPVSGFPNSNPEVDENEVAMEKKKTVVSYMDITSASIFGGLAKLGNWSRVKRVVIYVLQFINNIKIRIGEKKGADLSSVKIYEAEKALFGQLQASAWPTVLPNMKLTKDEDGLLRVETKITQLEEENSFRYPILLPGNSNLVKLFVIEEHERNSNANSGTLASILRDKFWITGRPRSIKSIVKSCPHCRIHTAQRCQAPEAPLPLDRITMTHCFGVCGVDLAGPLILKNGKKTWIVLFTCAVYRAVHLELVTSLSTAAFVVALRKFIARRGRPGIIYSDNGTNFHGCNNMLKKVDWEKIEDCPTLSPIKWIFNVATGSWWGGFFERLIGMMKQLLRRVLGNRSVDYWELEILVLEVEAAMNERPLTLVSSDPSDLQPLTRYS